MRPPGTLVASAVAVFAALVASGVRVDAAQQLRTFYFGNSFTGNRMPGLHPLLAKSVRKQGTVEASI